MYVLDCLNDSLIDTVLAWQEAASSRQDMERDQDRSEEASPSVSPRVDPAVASSGPGSYAERAKYIPLRLSQGERRLLRLLEAALSVSDYTDKVRLGVNTFQGLLTST